MPAPSTVGTAPAASVALFVASSAPLSSGLMYSDSSEAPSSQVIKSIRSTKTRLRILLPSGSCLSRSAVLARYSGTVTSFCVQAKKMLRRSTGVVSGFVEVNRVIELRDMHCGDGYVKYKCVASTNVSVLSASALAASLDLVRKGGFDALSAMRRS